MARKKKSLDLSNLFDYIDEKTKNLASKLDIKHLPTKEEFYSKMDEVMGELKAIRTAQEILSPKTYNFEERV